MLAGLRVIWRALRHLNQRGYLYVWGNFLWLVCSLPIITMPAAWGGLVRLSHAMHHRPGVTLDEYWDGLRENLRRGVVVALLNIAIIGINVTNLVSYANSTEPLIVPLRLVWIGVPLVWLSVQFYAFPLLYEMEQPTLWGAYRNALIMLVMNPLFTVTLWIGIALLLVFSLIFPVAWLLLTGGVLAILANAAVIDRLQAAGLKRPVESEAIES